MIKFAIVTTALLLSACSMPNTKPADGRDWVNVSCDGFADWSKCNEKAAQLCPGGYDTANREESLIAQHRAMSVACKK